jgi:dihydrofolate reductase
VSSAGDGLRYADAVKATVFVGASVDGFIARTNHTFDFLDVGGNEPHGFEEFMATVDALVMGRKTYEVVRPFEPWPYGTKPVFVLSTRRLAPPPAGAVIERMSGAPEKIVASLEARGLRHLYVDGGLTIQRFLRAGLIDRLIVTRVPVLIGTGIPLFGPLHPDVLLEHVETRTYAGGLVQTEYAVKPTERLRVSGAMPPDRRESRGGRARNTPRKRRPPARPRRRRT